MGMFDSIMQQRRPMPQSMPMQFVPPPPVAAMDLPTINPMTNAAGPTPMAPQGQEGGGMLGSIGKMFGGGAGAPAIGAAPGAAPGAAGGMDLSKILMMMGGM